MHAGTSPGGTDSRLAIFSGVTSPGISVRATTSREVTCWPTSTSTSPGMGNTRRARYDLRGVTVSPGVYAWAIFAVRFAFSEVLPLGSVLFSGCLCQVQVPDHEPNRDASHLCKHQVVDVSKPCTSLVCGTSLVCVVGCVMWQHEDEMMQAARNESGTEQIVGKLLSAPGDSRQFESVVVRRLLRGYPKYLVRVFQRFFNRLRARQLHVF